MTNNQKILLQDDKIRSIAIKNQFKAYLAWFIVLVSLLLIIFIIRADSDHNKNTGETSSDIIEVDGVKMKLMPANEQIEDIKNERAEIEKCSFDEKNITCIDVAGDKKEYKREYLQDFAY